MASRTIPAEVARRIARAASSRQTLAALTLTCKSLQAAAEKILYEVIELFPHPAQLYLLETLAECPRLAAYVRTYMLTPSPPYRVQPGQEREMQRTIQTMIERREFWEHVSASLVHLTHLELFVFVDPTLTHTWILDRALTLRTTEARLGIAWDEHVATFLQTQDRLCYLTVTEVAENVPLAPLPGDTLPVLTQFEGPLLVVDLLLRCPITHLKFPVDTEDAVSLLPLVLPELYRLQKLRSLSITALPPEMVLSSVSAISTACPNLQYLSHIPLPVDHKSHTNLLTHLSRFRHLKVLEVDVQHWSPPLTPPFQRAVATSLHVVLPALRYIFFWGRHERALWVWSPEDVFEPIQVRPQPPFPFGSQDVDAGLEFGGSGLGVGDEGIGIDIGAGVVGLGLGGAGGVVPATGGGAGAGVQQPFMAALEEPVSYVGLEGWQHSWNTSQVYSVSSSIWKTAV